MKRNAEETEQDAAECARLMGKGYAVFNKNGSPEQIPVPKNHVGAGVVESSGNTRGDVWTRE